MTAGAGGRVARLATLPLAFVLFFNVSGGAFTTEALVAAVGPGLALALLVAIPLVWAVPEALLIGELASMLPEEGGYYRWVHRAFGPAWAFQNVWCTWCYSVVEMALYPALFTQYLAWFLPGLDPFTRWGVALVLIWGTVAVNLRGAVPVGRVSVVLGLFVLAGFALLAVAALPRMTHLPWAPFVPPDLGAGRGLAVGVSIALWNFIGWDNASTVLGEVDDPGRRYPRALALAVPLVVAAYLVPLVPALGATDWTTWREGGWPDIARAAAGPLGPLLAPWLAVAALASAVGMFNSLLLTYSRIPLVLARDGLLPASLAATDARGTPRRAVVLAALCYSVLAILPFDRLVVADVILYAAALLLELAALVWLRRREPALRGPFRLPLGTTGIALLAALPALGLVAVVVIALADGELGTGALAAAGTAVALGPVLYLTARGAGRTAPRG